eukprot:1669949-Amphidinium_carterae.1
MFTVGVKGDPQYVNFSVCVRCGVRPLKGQTEAIDCGWWDAAACSASQIDFRVSHTLHDLTFAIGKAQHADATTSRSFGRCCCAKREFRRGIPGPPESCGV